MTRATTTVKRTQSKTEATARKAASSPLMQQLTRLGYFVRGVLYVGLGIVAIQMLQGRASKSPTPNGVIEMIGANPYGKFMLIVIAIGLVGYTLWGFIRATLDPFQQGDDAEGIAKRLGYVASAFGYATLLVFTVQYLLGAATSANNPPDWSAKLLGQTYGRILVGFIGLCWLVGGGLWQIYSGWRGDFVKELKPRPMSRNERQVLISAGRFGLIARGIVFSLIGLFLIQAAILSDPNHAKGFDGALLALIQQPYGPILFGIVAVGLIAFGIYSMLDALWIRVQVRQSNS